MPQVLQQVAGREAGLVIAGQDAREVVAQLPRVARGPHHDLAGEGRVEPGALARAQRLGGRGRDHARGQVVDQLRDQAQADRAAMGAALGVAHRVERRPCVAQRLRVAAAHDRQRPRRGAGRPPAHGAIEIGDAAGGAGGGELAGHGGGDGAHLDQGRGRRAGAEHPGDHLAHVLGVGDAGAGQVRAVGRLGDRGGEGGGKVPRPRGRTGVEHHLVTGDGQVADHPRAHQSGADEADSHRATIAPKGRRGSLRAVPTLDLVAVGAMPRRPVTLCPSAAGLRTAARGAVGRPSQAA